jgi:hypothetical protein
VGQDYVIMWRQKASDVVFPDDIDVILCTPFAVPSPLFAIWQMASTIP